MAMVGLRGSCFPLSEGGQRSCCLLLVAVVDPGLDTDLIQGKT